MDFPILIKAIRAVLFISCSVFPNYDVFLFLRIFFTFTNSVDTDEMQHYAAFHLGPHCLSKSPFRSFQ